MEVGVSVPPVGPRRRGATDQKKNGRVDGSVGLERTPLVGKGSVRVMIVQDIQGGDFT